MFRCNLNSKQLRFYIDSLLAKGLLEKERAPPSAKFEYRTTERGRRYLETYGTLVQMLTEEQKVANTDYSQQNVEPI
jgi:predicted transcriptional regulator